MVCNAVVCYAYLVDVDVGDSLEYEGSQFQKSRWYTRGWTLQELLAPRSVTFFNRGWVDIGTKLSLSGIIAPITRIGEVYIKHGYRCDSPADMDDLGEISSAQKMFWASKRETTRREDTAYCLMGLFDINMPMIYGEGTKAFKRLQMEIINSTTDQSIFYWCLPKSSDAVVCSPILAMSPMNFHLSDQINCGRSYRDTEFSITNRGLKISLPLTTTGGSAIALLNCFRQDGRQCGIRLYTKVIGKDNTHYRIVSSEIESFVPIRGIQVRDIYILDDLIDELIFDRTPEPKFGVLELRHHNSLLPIYQNMRYHKISCFQRNRIRNCRRVSMYEYGTSLEFDTDKRKNKNRVMLVFEELSDQDELSTEWPPTRGNYFALLVTFQDDLCFFLPLKPFRTETDKNDPSGCMEWHGGEEEFSGDRHSFYLQDGTSLRIALKSIMINGTPCHLVDVTSVKHFTLVSMGSPCCYPLQDFSKYSWPRYSAIRDLFKQPVLQIPAA
jgi:hypothetical protein